MAGVLEVTDQGIRPTQWHLVGIANELLQKRAAGHQRIMLPWLTEWKESLGCRTEELVGMIEYLVETHSPLLADFSLDMHLTDAVIQCRLQRIGQYDRSEWTDDGDTGAA